MDAKVTGYGRKEDNLRKEKSDNVDASSLASPLEEYESYRQDHPHRRIFV
ncbi:MAG: hypothetical protein QXW80_04625 [Candidatus Micrarchaeia archaeon]